MRTRRPMFLRGPALHLQRRGTLTRHALHGLFAVALVVSASEAFVGHASRPSAATAGTVAVASLGRSAGSPPKAFRPQAQWQADASGSSTSIVSALRFLGGATALGALASRARNPKRTRQSSSARRSSVVTTRAWPATAALAPPERQADSKAAPTSAALAAPAAPQQSDLLGLSLGFQAAPSPAPVAQAEVTWGSTTQPRKARRPGVARWAGSQRLPQQRHRQKGGTASSFGAARRERRDIGAGLLQQQAWAPGGMAADSYDPSRLRSKVQLGLRRSRPNSCTSKREAETPSAVKGVATTSSRLRCMTGFLKHEATHSPKRCCSRLGMAPELASGRSE